MLTLHLIDKKLLMFVSYQAPKKLTILCRGYAVLPTVPQCSLPTLYHRTMNITTHTHIYIHTHLMNIPSI